WRLRSTRDRPTALAARERRDVLRIVLTATLRAEEVVEAAAAGAGIGPADVRPRVVDRAAARLAVEKAAGGAEVLVRGVPQYPQRLTVDRDLAREAPLGERIVELEMSRQPG